MVTVLTFLPADLEFQALGRLSGPISVLRVAPMTGRPRGLILEGRGDYSIEISTDYMDVVFKFESFRLTANISNQADRPDAAKIAEIRDWDEIRCVFGFEWKRPAISGEVPEPWVQVVRELGPRDAIPATASALGVSMPGIVFWNEARDAPVTLIFSDHDEEPGAILIADDRDRINALISRYETVRLKAVPTWIDELREWLRKANFAG